MTENDALSLISADLELSTAFEFWKADRSLGRIKLARLADIRPSKAQKLLALLDASSLRTSSGKPAQTPNSKRIAIDDAVALSAENQKLHLALREKSRALDEALRKVAEDNDINQFYRKLKLDKVEAHNYSPSKRLQAERFAGLALLSDTHFDEVVNPAEISFINAYNRDIAVKRLQRFFKTVVELHIVKYEKLNPEVLFVGMLGDILSGNIHEELTQTNESSILESVAFWHTELVKGFKFLLANIEKIYVTGVVGNHGRNTAKPRCKGRVRDNFDYLLMSLVANSFHAESETRIQFYLPDNPDALFSIFDKRFLITHGDQFKGGGGIGGISVPILRGDAKKRKKQTSIQQPYDYLCLGHFHSTRFIENILMNGSIKGYDEFANIYNFDYDEPSQIYTLLNASRGVDSFDKIYVKDENEIYNADEDAANLTQGFVYE